MFLCKNSFEQVKKKNYVPLGFLIFIEFYLTQIKSLCYYIFAY
jgi:hypothetical protein